MVELFLDAKENNELDSVLTDMEEAFGTDYSFIPDTDEFSCKCSGPAQSCAWH